MNEDGRRYVLQFEIEDKVEVEDEVESRRLRAFKSNFNSNSN